MAEFDLESIIKSGVEEALNTTVYDGKTILEWAAIGMKNGGGWISVKERLPDEGKYVLVWESQGFAYCDKLICGIWNIGANNGAIITHWMPLPEPPEEGEVE